MGSSFKIGRIAGIQISVHASWIVALIFITWTISSLFRDSFPGWTSGQAWAAAVLGALALFASVLVHELAHSIIAMRLGLPVTGITLFIFGGVSQITGRYTRARDEFLVAFAGPASSLILGAIFWGLWALYRPDRGDPTLVLGIVSYLGLMNLLLGAFNLLPGFPLDGGRVLRSLVWGLSGSERRAMRVAVTTGRFMAMGMMGLGAWQIYNSTLTGGIWLIFIGLFLLSAARGEQHAERERGQSIRIPLRPAVQRTPEIVDESERVSDVMARVISRGFQQVVPVVSKGEPIGFLTSEDVRRFPEYEWRNLSVGSVIRRAAPQIFPLDGDAIAALDALRSNGAGHALVVAGDSLVGVVDEAGLTAVIRLSLEGGGASPEHPPA
jgi:Zn-dependent protease/CBS domain-containing protein